MRATIRFILAVVSTISLLMLALVAAGPASAQGDECALKVRPSEGPPGTVFVFSGSGYQPEQLLLKLKGGETKTLDVTPSEGDTFKIRLIAADGDVGRWTATAVSTADDCSASVRFAVALPPTATAQAPSPVEPDRLPMLAAMAALGALFVAVSVVVLPRLARSIRAR